MRTLGGRYALEQRVGIGGMSEVWRAHDLVLDRTVAAKLISPGQGGEDTSVERIRAEARSSARLVHPNVASVHRHRGPTRRRPRRPSRGPRRPPRGPAPDVHRGSALLTHGFVGQGPGSRAGE